MDLRVVFGGEVFYLLVGGRIGHGVGGFTSPKAHGIT